MHLYVQLGYACLYSLVGSFFTRHLLNSDIWDDLFRDVNSTDKDGSDEIDDSIHNDNTDDIASEDTNESKHTTTGMRQRNAQKEDKLCPTERHAGHGNARGRSTNSHHQKNRPNARAKSNSLNRPRWLRFFKHTCGCSFTMAAVLRAALQVCACIPLLPFASMFLDGIENVCVLILLASYPQRFYVFERVLSWVTPIKWWVTFVFFSCCLPFIVSYCLCCVRERKRHARWQESNQAPSHSREAHVKQYMR